MTTGHERRRRSTTILALVGMLGVWIAVAVLRSVFVFGDHGNEVALTVGVSALVLFGLPLLIAGVVRGVKGPDPEEEPDPD